MNRHAQCTAMGDVFAKYSILKVSPLNRASAASLELKNAALDKGANTIIVASTFYGDNMDKAKGEAYQCFLRRDWYEWELKRLNNEFKMTVIK